MSRLFVRSILFFMGRPIGVGVVLGALGVLGLYAAGKIPRQLMPSGFTAPFLAVFLPYPKANPHEVLKELTKPVEEALAGVRGVEELETISRNDACVAHLKFSSEANMDEAYMEVKERIDRILPELPEGADRYHIWKYRTDDEPIAWVALSYPKGLDNVVFLLDRRVKPLIERIPGVASVEFRGLVDRVLEIGIRPAALIAHRVDLYELVGRLREENFLLSAGHVEEGERKLTVISKGRLSQPEELEELRVRPDLRLGDIAEIGYASSLRNWISRVNGQPSLNFGVFKESGANTMEVSREVHRFLTEVMPQDPELGVFKAHFLFDQGKWISESLGTLRGAAWGGGLLAVGILVLFLRSFSKTLTIAFAIPLSVLLTLTIMLGAGSSLNLVSMMGLTLAVGVLVDNAIVVVDNVDRRLRQAGPTGQAIADGTDQVGLAITLSTLTTLVVFLPLVFLGGDATFRFFLREMALPICYSLLVSLAVAVWGVPVALRLLLGSRVRERSSRPRGLAWLAAKWTEGQGIVAAIERAYRRALGWVLGHRLEATLGALVVLGSMYYPLGQIAKVDRMEGNAGAIELSFNLPDHFTLSDASQVFSRMEATLEEHREELFIEDIFVSFRATRGWVELFLRSPKEFSYNPKEIEERVKSLLPRLPGVETRLGWHGPEVGDRSINLQLYGEDNEALASLAEEMARLLKGMPELISVETGVDRGEQEFWFRVNRHQADMYGVGSWVAAGTLSYALRGSELPPLVAGEHETPLWVKVAGGDTMTLEEVMNLRVASSSGMEAKLGAMTAVERRRGQAALRRQNRKSVLSIKATTRETDLDKVVEGMRDRLASLSLPPGYFWEEGGRRIEMQQNQASLLFSVVASIAFVFLLMGFLFESFVLPFCALLAIPFSFVGVYWTLYLWNTPFDVLAGIGMVILVGIVVNNSIVLVDRINRMRGSDPDPRKALLDASVTRLRPILMTVLTTVLAGIPMALGDTAVAGVPYYPLARAVGGGLACSTVFTLLVVPLAYSLIDDLRRLARAMFESVRRRKDVPLTARG